MTKLPKKGDKVTWSSPQGKVDGTVQSIATSETTIKGHVAKASPEAPQVIVKSDKSGKPAAHKPDSVKSK